MSTSPEMHKESSATEDPAPAPDNRSWAASARLFILLQVLSRLATFALNQFLVRLTSPEVLGAASIQFELLTGFVLTAAREGVRCVVLREGGQPELDGNLSVAAVAVGLVLDAACAGLYLFRASEELRASPYFASAVALFALGTALELFSEPLYHAVRSDVRVRVRAEALAVGTSCVTVLASMAAPVWFGIDASGGATYGLVCYGLGRTAFGLTLLVSYAWAARKPFYALRLRRHKDGNYLSPTALSLTWAMGQQALLKHVLGEADKLAVSWLGTLQDQGGYALASNYGSLVVRLLFQPIEEATRIAFSRTMTNATKPQLDAAVGTLSTLFRLHVLLGSFFVTFGPPLARIAIWILAGRQWACETAAPALLGAYACYIPMLGLNGLAEGFLTATATAPQLARYNRVLIGSSGVFLASLAVLQRIAPHAPTALIWSSILSAGARGAYSAWHMLGFFAAHGGPPDARARLSPAQLLPSPILLAALFGARAYLSARPPDACPASPELADLITAASLAVVCGALALYTERNTLRSIRSAL